MVAEVLIELKGVEIFKLLELEAVVYPLKPICIDPPTGISLLLLILKVISLNVLAKLGE